MNRELVITKISRNDKVYDACGFFEDKKAVELRIFPQEKHSILGNIYVGYVENLVKNINGAFVRIDKDTPCYLDMKKPVQAGQTFPVQVSKDAVQTKAPCVTTNLNFTGKYLVLTSENNALGFSAKIPKETKVMIKTWLEPLLDGSFGVVVRTNAAYGKKSDILNELEYLKKRLLRILEIGPHRSRYSLLEESYPFYLEAIRDVYTEDLGRIVTDIPAVYEKVKSYLEEYQQTELEKLELYEDNLLPLHKLFSMETLLENCLRERVWLSSGGFLVIQQTEAFVCIDVNTGKYTGKKKSQETFRKINLEAAGEIAKQLRLRNLSGIILIDFINMDREEHREELLHVLQKQVRKDPVKTKVIDMTPLNIVEVTRHRVRKSIKEEL